MYYNTRNQELINSIPLNGYFEDGSLVQGLNITDAETQKLCGIILVKSDSPDQPADTIEDISQRVVTIEEDGAVVVRIWIPAPVEPVAIPESISPRQIRLWFIQNNIPLATVENAINGIEDVVLRETTKVEWEYSPYVERNHPMINNLGAALGLTPEQIDQAFITASSL
jgi:hypothetical protein